MIYKVKYHAGTYSGIRTVTAEDSAEAIEKVKSWVLKTMTIPMYSEGYKIVSEEEDFEED